MTPAQSEAAPPAAAAWQVSRVALAVELGAPIAFLLLVWWNGLRCWFIADDFAWLGLLRTIHSLPDFLHAMFAPMAQGTIRPWSERGFFMLFESLFGMDALPFRVCVFATAAVDSVLISRLALRLTGSRPAAALAPVLWIANAALTEALCWTCAYNELLCPSFLLAALLLFIRWQDTGAAKWWWWQVVVFVLGFGALEINVVYPALALALCATGFRGRCVNPKRAAMSLISLFAISAGYYALHRLAATPPKSGPYVLYFDRRLFSTLALYWKWTVMPQNWRAIRIGRSTVRASIALLSAAFACGIAAALRAGRREVLFGLAWFLITIAPLLPLHDHVSNYYLTIPLIGVGISASAVAAWAFRRRAASRIAAAAAIAIYLTAMIPMSRIAARWWYERDLPIRAVVFGVAQAHENNPAKTIVLDGITDSVYNDAVANSAFVPLGVDHVYLTPETRFTVHPAGDAEMFRSVVMEPDRLRRAMLDATVVIYSFKSDHLRNITRSYRRKALAETAAPAGTDPQGRDEPERAKRRTDSSISLRRSIVTDERLCNLNWNLMASLIDARNLLM